MVLGKGRKSEIGGDIMNKRIALMGAVILLLFALASCAGNSGHNYYGSPYGYGNYFDGPNYYGPPY
jgi:ABC-type oligopeptide transport system substrate-binding subunit